jgi:hypothetical protein
LERSYGNCDLGLVLACDLTDDGSALGWHTLARLEAAVSWQQRTGGVLVVAATRSPYHSDQTATMAVMMALWLREQGVTEVCVLDAATFNTRGELAAFMAVPAKSRTIISAWWHVPRVKVIVRQMFGAGRYRQTLFVSAWDDRPTPKQLVLEPVKYVHVALPERWRNGAQQLWEKLFGRSAW